MNDEFSDAFKSIVPEAPSSDSWVDGALRKRRNRTRLLAGVAGGAAIAMILPLALALGGSNALIATPGETESPSPQVLAPVPVPGPHALGAAPCWDERGKARQVSAAGARDGAVRAWLCGDPDMVPQTVGPLEPLIQDVDVIVSFIQELAVTSVNDGCNGDAGPSYRIVLDYAGGSQSVLSGETAGCGSINDGQSIRAGGVELLDVALQLWRTQRDAFTPPGNVINLVNCLPESPVREKRPMFPLDPSRAVRGFLCTEVVTEDGADGAAGSLDDALVRLITDSIRVDSITGSTADLRPSWLTLTGGWGEQLTLQRTSADMFQWFDGDTPMLWKASAEVLAQLELIEVNEG
ncbi:hypothetical protein [Tessaracoccus sp.]